MVLVSPCQVSLTETLPTAAGKGWVSRNNEFDSSVLPAGRDDVAHLREMLTSPNKSHCNSILDHRHYKILVYSSIVIMRKYLLIAARLKRSTLPLDHLNMIVVVQAFVIWRSINNYSCHKFWLIILIVHYHYQQLVWSTLPAVLKICWPRPPAGGGPWHLPHSPSSPEIQDLCLNQSRKIL